MIETLNNSSQVWLSLMWAVLWQSALVALLMAGVCWLLRRSAPAVRYWLWQIVAIKLLLMPFWSAAIPLPSFATATPAETSASSDLSGPAAPTASPFLVRPTDSFGDGQARDVELPAESRFGWLQDITWQSWLFLAWLMIVAWQLARIIRMRYRLAWLLRDAKGGEPALTEVIAELSKELQLRRAPGVAVTNADGSPFVCGLRRPVLVLPQTVIAALEPTQLRQVLLHELAHLKRRDLVWGWIPEIGRMLYFFHPVVYWLGYRIRLERELACDQIAMALSNRDAGDYANTLVQVVTQTSQPAVLRAAALGSVGLSGETTLEPKQAIRKEPSE